MEVSKSLSASHSIKHTPPISQVMVIVRSIRLEIRYGTIIYYLIIFNFQYIRSKIRNSQAVKKWVRERGKDKLVKGVCLRDGHIKCFFVNTDKNDPQPLASHGTAILAISKVIFFKATHFLLAYLSPDMAMLVYLDTDIHTHSHTHIITSVSTCI